MKKRVQKIVKKEKNLLIKMISSEPNITMKKIVRRSAMYVSPPRIHFTSYYPTDFCVMAAIKKKTRPLAKTIFRISESGTGFCHGGSTLRLFCVEQE